VPWSGILIVRLTDYHSGHGTQNTYLHTSPRSRGISSLSHHPSDCWVQPRLPISPLHHRQSPTLGTRSCTACHARLLTSARGFRLAPLGTAKSSVPWDLALQNHQAHVYARRNHCVQVSVLIDTDHYVMKRVVMAVSRGLQLVARFGWRWWPYLRWISIRCRSGL
jgi:hypothetical protein